MQMALKEAKKAFNADEVPIGAILVDPEGIVVGRGFNHVEKKRQQSAHAEVIAISRASKKRGDWRLDGHTLYVTLEPCMMCMGLVRLSRIDRVVYGADSLLFGYQLDKERQGSLYKKDIKVEGACLAEESSVLLKKFFKQKRKRSD